MTARPCVDCGDVIATGTRCDECRTIATPGKFRDRTHAHWNTARWKRLSKRLRRMQPWCSTCGSTNDLTVDHIVPIALRPDLTYTLSNLDVLCRSCNGRKDAATRTRGSNPSDLRVPSLGKAEFELQIAPLAHGEVPGPAVDVDKQRCR